jgi:hypothetical protein
MSTDRTGSVAEAVNGGSALKMTAPMNQHRLSR